MPPTGSRQAIRHALINTTATIRLPAWMVGLLTRWRRAERALGRELGQAPGFDEIASSLGLSDAQRTMVARALDAGRLRLEGSSDDGVGAGGTSPRRRTGTDDLDEQAGGRGRAGACCGDRLGRLDDRERAILTLRYGLEGDPPLTLKEIGRRLGVTREWVRKLEIRGPSQARPPAGHRCGRRPPRARSIRRREFPAVSGCGEIGPNGRAARGPVVRDRIGHLPLLVDDEDQEAPRADLVDREIRPVVAGCAPERIGPSLVR